MRNRRILYAHKPADRLSTDDFRVEETTVGEPHRGEVLCRTVPLSVDPAHRAWMQGRTGLIITKRLRLEGFLVGRARSRTQRLSAGQSRSKERRCGSIS